MPETQPDVSKDVTEQTAKKPAGRRGRLILLAVIVAAAGAVYLIQRRGARLEGWEKDLPAALQRARQEDRPLLVYFVRSTRATVVQRMAKTTLVRPGNIQAIEEGGFIRVVVSTSVNAPLAKRYGLKKLPTMVVLTAEGEPAKRSEAFIGETDFRDEFLEPDFAGWASTEQQDLDGFVASAHAADRPVLMVFAGPVSNGPTRRLAFTALAASAVTDALAAGGFEKIVVRAVGTAQYPGQPEKDPQAVRYNITTFPTALVLYPTGASRRCEGFVNAEAFARFLAEPTTQPAGEP